METECLNLESPNTVLPQPGKGSVRNHTGISGEWVRQEWAHRAHMSMRHLQPCHPFPLGCKSCSWIHEHAAAQAAKHWKSQAVYSNHCWHISHSSGTKLPCMRWFKAQQTTLTLLSLPQACQLEELSIKTIWKGGRRRSPISWENGRALNQQPLAEFTTEVMTEHAASASEGRFGMKRCFYGAGPAEVKAFDRVASSVCPSGLQ